LGNLGKKSELIFFVFFLLIFNFGCSKNKEGFEIFMAADTDHDGQVDFEQDSWDASECTDECAAVFLNNCDSDQNTGKSDYADAVINGEEDLKDLSLIRVKRMKDLPADTQVSISVDAASKRRVQIFLKVPDGNFECIDLEEQGNLDIEQLTTTDLELWIESNSFADTAWSGKTQVKLTLELPDGLAKEKTICLKVAPFILLSNLQRGKTLYVRAFPGRNDVFIQQLERFVPEAEAELFIVPEGDPYRSHDIWLQDAMEIGYTEKPGQRMNVVLQANRERSLDNFPSKELLGPDYGWIRVGSYRETYARGRGGNGWLDWYGNLEVTPPLPEFPFGRIVYGFNPEGPPEASLNPEIVAMLEAQELQTPPIRLDTGWLLIKHVDEMISFLPSQEPGRPCCVMVVSPEAMIGLLREWKAEGYGTASVLKRFQTNTTVASLLSNEKLLLHNIRLQRDRIESNIAIIKKELRLSEEDFIRIPALFSEHGSSIFPNMVNSAVLNGYLLIADPDGPVVDGVDLLQEEVKRLLSGVPVHPVFLNDTQYHKWSGNVHCATNIRREGHSISWFNNEHQ
jgi:protein-arginine deiminase